MISRLIGMDTELVMPASAAFPPSLSVNTGDSVEMEENTASTIARRTYTPIGSRNHAANASTTATP